MEKYKNLIAKAQEPLSDKEYLNKYISDVLLFKPHKIIGIRDTNSVMLGITKAAVQKKNWDIYFEKNYYDIPDADNFADIFYQQDRQIEKDKSFIRLLHVNYPSEFSIVDCIRQVIINPFTKNVVGTYVHHEEPKLDFGLKTILELHSNKFGKNNCMDISNNTSYLNLTNIERDVLFCVCLGINNHKDVANFLSIIYNTIIHADPTIHDTFRRLYRKLNCNTSVQLLDLAFASNFHLKIPDVFLPKGVFTLNQASQVVNI